MITSSGAAPVDEADVVVLPAPTKAAAPVCAGCTTRGPSGGAAGGGANVGKPSPVAETTTAVVPVAADCGASSLRAPDDGAGSVGSSASALSWGDSASGGVGRKAVGARLGTVISAVSGRGGGSAPDPRASASSRRVFFRSRRAGCGGWESAVGRFCGDSCADPVGGHVGVTL